MISYLVIGLCIILLVAVIYISSKPISMGIEARRNLNQTKDNKNINMDDLDELNMDQINKKNISDEILKLNKLKNDGILTEDEYKKAKNKLLD